MNIDQIIKQLSSFRRNEDSPLSRYVTTASALRDDDERRRWQDSITEAIKKEYVCVWPKPEEADGSWDFYESARRRQDGYRTKYAYFDDHVVQQRVEPEISFDDAMGFGVDDG